MNHAFVTTKANLSPDKVHELLTRIIRDKWGDVVKIRRVGDSQWDMISGDDMTVGPRIGMCLWMRSRRTLEMRKHVGDLSSWFQAYVQETLAQELKGRCRNDGAQGTWAPEPEKFQTYQQWREYNSGGWPVPPLALSRFPAGLLGK